MLSSGAHVKIGNDEFHLDRSVMDHYIRRWYDLDDQEDPRIAGDTGKQKRNAETLFWTYTDWAGGEGNRVYNPEEPDRYDVGYELNPRYRGQLTGRPNRRRTTLTAKEISDRPVMTVGAGAVWVMGGYNIHYSTGDPTTWTEKANSATAGVDYTGLRSLSTSYRITAAAGDNDYVYYSAWHSASDGTRVTLRCVKSDAAVPEVVEAQADGTAPVYKAPYAGLALMKGDLFAWTGRKLYQMEVSNVTSGDTNGLTGTDQIRKVYDTSIDPASTNVFSADWWADCVATENSIVMFYSNDGISKVYEYKKGVGRPIWTPPYGFTIKGLTYNNGVVYLSGHWGGDENKAGATATGVLYAIPLNSYQPFPVHNFRDSQNVNLQMQEMHASYGYQVIVTAQRTGRIFIYDAKSDGVTMLDDLEADPDSGAGADIDGLEFDDNDHRIGGSITWGQWRYFSIYRPGSSGAGSYQVIYYDDDRPEQRETGLTNNPTSQYEFYNGYFDTPRWDYGYPMDKKTLVGFHLTFKPLASGMTIRVDYCVDDSTDTNTFTQASSTITSATTGASVGRVFLPVSTGSSTVKFLALRYRVTLMSSSGVKTPILYSVTAEAAVTRKRREWELVLRVKDEASRNPRPSHREVRGWRLRDALETSIEAGSAVTFLDGYRYGPDAQYGTYYSTHNVVIKKAEDIIIKPGEGTMRVLLRSVDLSD